MDGLTVMLNRLFGDGGKMKAIWENSKGRTIKSVEMKKEDPDYIRFEFEGAGPMEIYDDGQSCCESRYMTTDDDLKYYAGATLMDIEVKDGPCTEDKYGEPHDQQFLVVKTSKGEFTVVTHVEHNGYYGGFSITLRAGEEKR